jgi:hypothetical protein
MRAAAGPVSFVASTPLTVALLATSICKPNERKTVARKRKRSASKYGSEEVHPRARRPEEEKLVTGMDKRYKP